MEIRLVGQIYIRGLVLAYTHTGDNYVRDVNYSIRWKFVDESRIYSAKSD